MCGPNARRIGATEGCTGAKQDSDALQDALWETMSPAGQNTF